MNSRRPLAVIMARGESRRMGRPKGLCRTAGDVRPLVRRVADLYSDRGWPLLVVVREPEADAHHSALHGTSCSVLPCPAGGDTARTLWYAWRWVRQRQPDCTHLWAHPVDLPTVRAGTLEALVGVLAQRDLRAVRPAYRSTPGHPVVLGRRLLDAVLPATAPDGSMLDLLRAAQTGEPDLHVHEIAVDDPGVVRDFDSPADLASFLPAEGADS